MAPIAAQEINAVAYKHEGLGHDAKNVDSVVWELWTTLCGLGQVTLPL